MLHRDAGATEPQARARGLQWMTLSNGQALAGAYPYAGSSPGKPRSCRRTPRRHDAVRRASITGIFVTAKSGDKAARFPTLLPWRQFAGW
jgi:hypothetical protein